MKKKILYTLLAISYLIDGKSAFATQEEKQVYFVNSTQHLLNFKLTEQMADPEKGSGYSKDGNIHNITLSPDQPLVVTLRGNAGRITQLSADNGFIFWGAKGEIFPPPYIEHRAYIHAKKIINFENGDLLMDNGTMIIVPVKGIILKSETKDFFSKLTTKYITNRLASEKLQD